MGEDLIGPLSLSERLAGPVSEKHPGYLRLSPKFTDHARLMHSLRPMILEEKRPSGDRAFGRAGCLRREAEPLLQRTARRVQSPRETVEPRHLLRGQLKSSQLSRRRLLDSFVIPLVLWPGYGRVSLTVSKLCRYARFVPDGPDPALVALIVEYAVLAVEPPGAPSPQSSPTPGTSLTP